MGFQVYTPFVCDISAVASAGADTLVTTAIDHAFVIGNLIRFQIPQQYGMRQLNQLEAYVISVPAANQLLMNIDTRAFDPFVIPTLPQFVVIDPAQTIPVGDANSGTLAPGGILSLRTIPGAYQAIVI